MFRKMLLAYKWRKLRICVWEKRLLQHLNNISSQVSPTVQCSLHLSWGPFYGGSVIMNRRYTKAKILIQIPYDRYVTSDEVQVMSRYSISTHALPYFIFFHECFHVMDSMTHLDRKEGNGLDTYQAALKRATRMSKNYRMLPTEACADDFAYQQYVELCQKTEKVG